MGNPQFKKKKKKRVDFGVVFLSSISYLNFCLFCRQEMLITVNCVKVPTFSSRMYPYEMLMKQKRLKYSFNYTFNSHERKLTG